MGKIEIKEYFLFKLGIISVTIPTFLRNMNVYLISILSLTSDLKLLPEC